MILVESVVSRAMKIDYGFGNVLVKDEVIWLVEDISWIVASRPMQIRLCDEIRFLEYINIFL